jgi:prepilin peptidase CpaA
MALLAIFAVAGFLVIPLDAWLWRWLSAAAVLVIGILLNQFANVGAGDAKFAAAAAPFFVQKVEHLSIALVLLAFWLLATFFLHRAVRAIPAVRRLSPDWKSWSSARFPMGLALVAVLLSYLALVAFPGFCAATYGRFSPVCG